MIKDKIVADFESGFITNRATVHQWTVQRFASHYGVTTRYIRKMFNQLGAPELYNPYTKGRKNFNKALEDGYLEDLLETDLSLDMIAERIGVSHTALGYMLKEHNLSRPQTLKYRKPSKDWDLPIFNRVKRLALCEPWRMSA